MAIGDIDKGDRFSVVRNYPDVDYKYMGCLLLSEFGS